MVPNNKKGKKEYSCPSKNIEESETNVCRIYINWYSGWKQLEFGTVNIHHVNIKCCDIFLAKKMCICK